MDGMAAKGLEAVRSGATKILPQRFEKVYFNWLENIQAERGGGGIGGGNDFGSRDGAGVSSRASRSYFILYTLYFILYT